MGLSIITEYDYQWFFGGGNYGISLSGWGCAVRLRHGGSIHGGPATIGDAMHIDSDHPYIVRCYDSHACQWLILCWDEYFRHNPDWNDVRKFANKGLAIRECNYLDRHGMHGCAAAIMFDDS